MKLELQNVCPYLPHELNMYRLLTWAGVDKPEIITLNGAKQDGPDLLLHTYSHVYDNTTSRFKMALRPLSDLTKEITHKGETFVPIQRIANDLGYKEIAQFILDGEIQWGWDEQNEDDQQGWCFHWDAKLKTFGVYHDCYQEGYPVYQVGGRDQISLLQSWMFDLDGFIESGLAISIHDLSEDPYK